jgi:hypothetical protein
VGLAEQRISIYDAKGKIMESPVSSGQTGYETPAGIYSIVQKEEEHHSNLYDDASMPFMERITWTGMALHAGVLPGYAASHGCVRLPLDFAERLYDKTNMGMRVLVVREEIAPAEIAQPFIFGSAKHKAPAADRSLRDGVSPTRYPPSDDGLSQLRMTLAQKSAEAQNAARKVKDLRLAASKSATEAASASRSLQAVESNFVRSEADVKAVEQALGQAAPDKVAQLAEEEAQALSRLNVAQTELDKAKAQAQSKADAAAQAQADAKAADAALALALDAADEARLNLAPVSVFVSRKTMRLYVRKANNPVYESPVMIRDPGKQIGSFVFTALEPVASGMRWNVVSMYKDATHIEPFSKEKQSSSSRRREPEPADVRGAEAALGRLTIPEDALDYLSQAVLPGSSLIISDEGPSIETGKDTDFVIFMSGEPQGGIAVRAHHNEMARRDRGSFEGDWWGSGWSQGEQSRQRRANGWSRGGGWVGGGSWGGFPF